MTDTTYTCPGTSSVPMPDADFRRGQRRSAVFWGCMLIVLGSATLAAEFVPAVAWWMTWPVVPMVFGAAHALSPDRHGVWSLRRPFEGLTTVLVGAVLLGNTTGYVSWAVWVTFLSLWPLLLIALGISVIGRGLGSEAIRIVARLVVWASLGLALWVTISGAPLGFVDSVTVVTVPGAGARGESVNITIEPGDGVPSIRTW